MDAVLKNGLLIDGNGGEPVPNASLVIREGKIEAVGVYVRNDDMPGPAMPCDGRGHDADGPCAGDEYVLAEQVETQGCVGRVAQRVETTGDLQRDVPVRRPYVGYRDGKELGERAGAVHTDATGVGAQVPSAGQAVTAPTANNVTFATD